MGSIHGAATDSVAARRDFDLGAVAAFSGAHFVHDIYLSFLGPLLPLIIANLSIPIAAAGGLAAIVRLSTLLQPFLGVWADQRDMRWLIIVAPGITAISMSSLGLAPDYLSVALLLAVAGLSSAVFHPPTAAAISYASGRSVGRGTSLYVFAGEMARAVGPILIVTLVTYVGLQYSYLAAVFGLLFSVLLYFQMRHRKSTVAGGASARAIWEGMKSQRRPLLLLSGMILFRSTAVQSVATFLATYLTGRGSSLMYAGMALALYELAGAFGALACGTLSDRMGRKTMMLASQWVAGPLLLLALWLPDGVLGVGVLAAAGALALSATPVQLALAQELLPLGRSTAAGIVIFLGFEGTVVATVVVGFAGDLFGLGPALAGAAAASMLSIPFTMALPETVQDLRHG